MINRTTVVFTAITCFLLAVIVAVLVNAVFSKTGKQEENVPISTSLWQEEYKEGKALGAETLYMCNMELHCATYMEAKLVGLCGLVKSESSPYSGTVAVSLNGILHISNKTHIFMKACPKKQRFMPSRY